MRCSQGAASSRCCHRSSRPHQISSHSHLPTLWVPSLVDCRVPPNSSVAVFCCCCRPHCSCCRLRFSESRLRCRCPAPLPLLRPSPPPTIPPQPHDDNTPEVPIRRGASAAVAAMSASPPPPPRPPTLPSTLIPVRGTMPKSREGDPRGGVPCIASGSCRGRGVDAVFRRIADLTHVGHRSPRMPRVVVDTRSIPHDEYEVRRTAFLPSRSWWSPQFRGAVTTLPFMSQSNDLFLR